MTIYKPRKVVLRETSPPFCHHRCPASRTARLSPGCSILLLIATCRHNPSLVLPVTNKACHSRVQSSEIEGSTYLWPHSRCPAQSGTCQGQELGLRSPGLHASSGHRLLGWLSLPTDRMICMISEAPPSPGTAETLKGSMVLPSGNTAPTGFLDAIQTLAR